MTPQTLDLDPFTEGDHWEGIPAMTIQINDMPPDRPLTKVRIRFRPTDKPVNSQEANTRVELSNADTEQIQIVDADTWEISAPKQPLALTFGSWAYNIETTDADGVVWTPVAGTIQILQDV